MYIFKPIFAGASQTPQTRLSDPVPNQLPARDQGIPQGIHRAKTPSIYCGRDQWSDQEGGERREEHEVEKDVLHTTIQRYLQTFLLRGVCFLGFSIWKHGLPDANTFHGSTAA